MYKALENMGLKTGNILEPSCGVGNFIGMLPDSLEDCKLYGVELDSISGRIARQLYQKSTVAVQGYEDTNLPNSFFDVAVGNVPFGDFKVLDKKYDKHKFLIDKNVSHIIRKIFDMILDGESRRQVAEFLNDNDILTPSEYLNINKNKNVKIDIK